MNEQLAEFIMSPSRELYLELRDVVIASEFYAPYSDEFETAVRLFEEENFDDARETIQNGMPNLILSPRAHHLLSYLHFKAGDKKTAQFEFAFSEACLKGILATGDGSIEKPYLVTRTSDEYDVLEHLGKELTRQALAESEDRRLDVMTCRDGATLSFDITDAYDQLSQSFDDPFE